MSEKKLAEKNSRDMKMLGLWVDPGGVKELHAYMDSVISRNEKAFVINLNAHALSLAIRLPWMHAFIQEAHFVVCDGDGARLGLKWLGYDPPPKIPTTRWIWDLAQLCAEKKYRIFLLGGEKGIADEAAQKLKEQHPELQIAGTQHGYFKKEGPENDQVIKAINDSKPNVIMVCFGMPLQEKWISENWERLDVNIFLNGGGVFDYVTGRLGKAPEWMLRLYMEWVFRIYEQPRRLLGRYLFDIPYFFWNLIWLRQQKPRRGKS